MLCLNARFHNIQGSRNDTGHASRGRCCQNFQWQSNVVRSHISFCHPSFLLVKCELESGEGKIAPEGRFVAIIQSAGAFCPDYGADGVHGGAVVIAGVEVGIVVAALELETCFEDFGGNVGGCGGEICY